MSLLNAADYFVMGNFKILLKYLLCLEDAYIMFSLVFF